MTDFEGMRLRFWLAIWENAREAINKVLQEAWRDGYTHGFQNGYDKRTEEEPIEPTSKE